MCVSCDVLYEVLKRSLASFCYWIICISDALVFGVRQQGVFMCSL